MTNEALQIEVLEAQKVLTTKQYNLRIAQLNEQIAKLQAQNEQPQQE